MTKRLVLLTLLIGLALLLDGCARFHTTQIDRSVGPDGQIVRVVETRTSAGTFFDSDSSLANLSTSQSDQTQNTEVGSLNQSSTSESLDRLKGLIGEILIQALTKGQKTTLAEPTAPATP